MFKRILIANRGEIAKRILKSCLKLNIKPICIYSEADKNAAYLSEAYKSVYIGKSPLHESYLNSDKIFDIAVKYNCEAIHPGFGFFSENYLFSLKCKQKKITFIGPDSHFIKTMGDKIVARETMQNLGIPVIPGTSDPYASNDKIIESAKRIGFPLLIKASAGGGGKGITFINDLDMLKRNIDKARFESKSIFASDKIYLEKFIDDAKHIEVQVAGDLYGNVIHFHERECSIQRNNQKLIEESPSPVINKKKLDNLKKTVAKAMREIKYNSLGTLEFLLDKNDNYYFIEANTRLQVEHTITEMTTKYDLVDLQIRISMGEYIDIDQDSILQQGHAIECRINAENPRKNFSPSLGKIKEILLPEENKNIRIESHISKDFVIAPFYDSMLAKIIIHKENRSSAINLMKDIMNKIKIVGINTSIGLHISILESRDFNNGNYTCNFLKDNIKKLLVGK